MSHADRSSPGQSLLKLWNRLHALPAGKTLFAWVISRQVPYSGSLGARVEQLEPGYCRVSLRDRRKIRNHLNSIHALALANLGELVSGLAMLTQLPPSVRGIVTRIDTEYHKKARGTLTAESRPSVAAVTAPREEVIQAVIRDASGELVTTVSVTWSLRPRES